MAYIKAAFFILFLGGTFSGWSQSKLSYFEKADSLKLSKNYSAYLGELHAIIDASKRTKKNEVRLHAYTLLLEHYEYVDFNHDSIKKYFSRGKALAQRTGSDQYVNHFDALWGNYLVQKGEYTRALALFQSLEEDVVKNNYPHLPYFYDSYARLLYYLEDYDMAFGMLKKEAEIYKSQQSHVQIAGVYNNLGILYRCQDQMDSSLYYHNESQEINVALKDTQNIVKSYNNIGFTYYTFKDVENARKYYEMAYNYAPGKATNSLLINYAELLLTSSEYAKAERFLLTVVDNSSGPAQEKEALTQLVKLKKKEGKFEEAVAYMEELSAISQKLMDETKVKEIERLKISYETAKKEQEIKTLETTNASQKTIITKNRWLVVVVLIVLALAVVIFFLLLRNKENTNKMSKLMLEQRLFRSQMNPHFIFNVLSNIQTNILKHENDKAVSYLVKFSSLLRFNLERSNFETVLFSEELKAIVNYLDMQKLRMDDQLKYEIDVESSIDTDDIEIPAMMLQPIVENAIEHGVEKVEHPQIKIAVSDHETFISCVITDNGPGYSSTIEKKRTLKKSFATNAIIKRLSYLSKKTEKELVYSIKDVIGEDGAVLGAEATIHLPI